MRRGIVSDIHGNFAALKAVLKDAQRMRLDEIVCLGDVIGYGARPGQCLDVARQFPWTVKGNHEMGLLEPQRAEGFSHRARDAVAWTRDLLALHGDLENERRRRFLQSLPESHREGDILYCHGSPRDFVGEYIFPNLGEKKPDALKDIFEALEHIAFVGHTHCPGVHTEDMLFQAPLNLGNEYEIGPGKAIINVGSVGQPRDRNNRASYVVFDRSVVTFRRVHYDVEMSANRIYSVPELDDSLGDRLFEGR